MPEDVCNYVSKHSNFTQVKWMKMKITVLLRFQKKFTDLAEGIRHVDVVYVTRIQKERFANPVRKSLFWHILILVRIFASLQ